MIKQSQLKQIFCLCFDYTFHQFIRNSQLKLRLFQHKYHHLQHILIRKMIKYSFRLLFLNCHPINDPNRRHQRIFQLFQQPNSVVNQLTLHLSI